MYSPRVKTYDFGVIVSNAGGIAIGSTGHPINGELLKLQWNNHDSAAGGSIFLQVQSPFTETLGSIIATNSDQVLYLNTQGVVKDNAVFPVVNDILVISGGGFGNTLSGAAVLYYR